MLLHALNSCTNIPYFNSVLKTFYHSSIFPYQPLPVPSEVMGAPIPYQTPHPYFPTTHPFPLAHLTHSTHLCTTKSKS